LSYPKLYGLPIIDCVKTVGKLSGCFLGLALGVQAGVFNVHWNVEDQGLGPAGIISTTGEHDDFNPVGNTSVVSISSPSAQAFTGSAKAMSFDGSGDRFNQQTWNGVYNGIDKDLATFEMYFSPASLGSRREILFETGGNGDGLTLGIENDGRLVFGAVSFNSNGGINGNAAGHAEIDLQSGLFSGFVPGTDFFYARAHINAEYNFIQLRVEDKNGNVLSNKQTLLNGTTDFLDWTGGNNAGLGGANGDYARGSAGTDSFMGTGAFGFQGQIASFGLTYSKVPEPSTAAYCALFVVLMATWRNRRKVSFFGFMDREDEGPAVY
jgi:hypothetical protein